MAREDTPLLLESGDAKEDAQEENNSSIFEDAIDTLHLAAPIFISRLSFTGMKTTDTALLGHVSGKALSAAALSDLWTMCTGVFIQGTAVSILAAQAVGADNHNLALIYLRISYFVLGLISIFLMVSWCYTEQIWIMMGQSRDVAKAAGYYSYVFVFSIPAQLAFSQMSQFLLAHRIMQPEVTTSMIALGFNLLLGSIFVLGFPIPGFDGLGFEACPIVTVVVVWIQSIVLWTFFRDFLKTDSSYSLNKRDKGAQKQNFVSSMIDGITFDRIRTYSALYFPAALALASDFWRMGLIGAIAATMGEREVGLFNASYRILWITLIFVGAISAASGIKIGSKLGSGQSLAARTAAFVGISLVMVCLIVLATLVYYNTRLFGRIFTNDESYLDLFEECRLPFTLTLFFMNLAVGIEAIPLSIGRTGSVFYCGVFASWLGQVPGVLLLTKYWRNDLFALYSGIAGGYCGLVFLYGGLVLKSDWKKYSEIARKRVEVSEGN
jgi:MATE family multidrug resistance protein